MSDGAERAVRATAVMTALVKAVGLTTAKAFERINAESPAPAPDEQVAECISLVGSAFGNGLSKAVELLVHGMADTVVTKDAEDQARDVLDVLSGEIRIMLRDGHPTVADGRFSYGTEERASKEIELLAAAFALREAADVMVAESAALRQEHEEAREPVPDVFRIVDFDFDSEAT